MNLKEFIDHRQYCPLCETQLVTLFHSTRKQTIKMEEHRFLVFFALDGTKVGQKPYATAYSFNLLENVFQVEFYTKDKSARYETGHDFLIKRFLELHKNLKNFKFVRECTFCEMYAYSTQQFEMNLRSATFDPINVYSEHFGLVQPIKDGYRVYKLLNTYSENKSDLTFWKGNPRDARFRQLAPASWQNPTKLYLPLIPFISKEETTKRLSNLIIFT